MTSDAIRSAFGHLRTDSEMIPLADAVLCRVESDWLVGINAARAMIDCLNPEKVREVGLTFVGRAQTPTLAMLVDREESIRMFKSKTYWEVLADFAVSAGRYRGRWFDDRGHDQNHPGRRRISGENLSQGLPLRTISQIA
jgi:DNA topoisomerase III